VEQRKPTPETISLTTDTADRGSFGCFHGSLTVVFSRD